MDREEPTSRRRKASLGGLVRGVHTFAWILILLALLGLVIMMRVWLFTG